MKSLLIAAAFLSATALSGCVSILPEPFVPTALISLPADRAVAPPLPLMADVAVYSPETSRAFESNDIAVRDSQELIYLDQVRWADGAPHLLQGAVVNSLTKAGGTGRAVPAELGADVDYDVRWRIIDLSAGKETSPVRVEVQASVMDSSTRRMVAQQTFVTEGSPTDRAPRARAAALAIAAQQVADKVAAFVTETVKAK
ncbi:MAG: ABC-type transport auxiliary lipoprotein family protein [Hyphomonadaceae bacterium]|jgi:cholesterol transport system auxiliary component